MKFNTKPPKKQKTKTRGRKENSKNGPDAKKTGPKPKPTDLDRQKKERDAAQVIFNTFVRKVKADCTSSNLRTQ